MSNKKKGIRKNRNKYKDKEMRSYEDIKCANREHINFNPEYQVAN